MKSQACTKKISYESQAYSIKLCMVTCSMELKWKRHFTLHAWSQRLPFIALVDDYSQICWQCAPHHSLGSIQ